MTKTETVKHDKKELVLSTAISLLSNLNAGDLADATAYIEALLTKQQSGESRNTIVVEAGAIQEMDIALENVEYLISKLDDFVYYGDFNDCDQPHACVICRMLMDYGEKLREQLSELIKRI